MIIINKRLSHDQFEALEEAKRNAMHAQPLAMQEALELYCAKYGVEFPATGQHGGTRQGAGRKPKLQNDKRDER